MVPAGSGSVPRAKKKFRLRLSRKILRKRSSAEVPQPEEPEVPALWFRLGILMYNGGREV